MSDMTVDAAAAQPLAAPESPRLQSAKAAADYGREPMTVTAFGGSGVNRMTIVNGPYSAWLVDASSSVAAYVSYGREEAVVDFAKGVISHRLPAEAGLLEEDGDTGAYRTAGTSVRIAFSASSYRAGLLEDTAGRLIAACEEQERSLRDRFSGEALEARLAELEDLYRQGKDAAADAFANMLGGFWDRHGRPGQTERIRSSVQALLAAFEEEYHAAAAGGNAGAQSGWISGGMYAFAAKAQMPDKQDELYTFQELEAAAISISVNSQADAGARRYGRYRHIPEQEGVLNIRG